MYNVAESCQNMIACIKNDTIDTIDTIVYNINILYDLRRA